MSSMRVAELWRYPVKSLGGEQLEIADISANGIKGDRVVHVQNSRGKVVTSRSKPGLLALKGTLGSNGEPLINGRLWTAPESITAVRAAARQGAKLVRYDGIERFDVLPIHVATDGAIKQLGVDRRRLRPNIVIAGVEGLAERNWPGHRLRIGEVIIAVRRLRPRCIMTTFDPDTQVQDVSVLHRIHSQFGGSMALDCDVLKGGRITVGDLVEIRDLDE